jgi:pilus assembly protein Flp/PilA
VKSSLRRLLADRSGVTAIEYGMIAALIAVAIVATVSITGVDLRQTFQTIASQLEGDGGGGAGVGIVGLPGGGGGGGGGGIVQGPSAP